MSLLACLNLHHPGLIPDIMRSCHNTLAPEFLYIHSEQRNRLIMVPEIFYMYPTKQEMNRYLPLT